MYVVCLLSPSRGGRKGGVTFGKFWKLLGNLAVEVEAIAEAFRIAKGFFPVIELPAAAPPETKLLVPLVLVVLDIPPFGPLVAVGC